MWLKPGTSGSKGSRYFFSQVAERAPIVRPWKPRMAATISVRPVSSRANLTAASTASVPELHKKTRTHAGQPAQLLFSCCPAVVVEHLRAGDQGLAWSAIACGHGRVGVPEVGRALPAHAVDVFVAVGVPQAGALPAHDGDRALGVYTGGILVFQLPGSVNCH